MMLCTKLLLLQMLLLLLLLLLLLQMLLLQMLLLQMLLLQMLLLQMLLLQMLLLQMLLLDLFAVWHVPACCHAQWHAGSQQQPGGAQAHRGCFTACMAPCLDMLFSLRMLLQMLPTVCRHPLQAPLSPPTARRATTGRHGSASPTGALLLVACCSVAAPYTCCRADALLAVLRAAALQRSGGLFLTCALRPGHGSFPGASALLPACPHLGRPAAALAPCTPGPATTACRVYNDSEGREHVQLQFHMRGPSGRATVNAGALVHCVAGRTWQGQAGQNWQAACQCA